MNADYWPIGGNVRSFLPVSMAELAGNIATDWLPTRPSAVSTGMTDLLGEVLYEEQFAVNRRWIVNRQLTGMDRQWRGVTSYICGVAFCRKIAEILGYTWCVPVSFYWQNTQPNLFMNWWSPFFNIRDCVIQKGVLSNLLPDYLLARRSTSGAFEIAFCESKGTSRALQNLSSPPTTWRNQSRNAAFVYQGAVVQPVQCIIVATRIQPRLIRATNRVCQVRVWNVKEEVPPVPAEAIRAILLTHYMAVFRCVGLGALANCLIEFGPEVQRQVDGATPRLGGILRELLHSSHCEKIRIDAQVQYEMESQRIG